jgi:hypothetical protein
LLAAIGGYLANVYLRPVNTWRWQWHGVAVVPALLTTTIIAVLAEAAATRLMKT